MILTASYIAGTALKLPPGVVPSTLNFVAASFNQNDTVDEEISRDRGTRTPRGMGSGAKCLANVWRTQFRSAAKNLKRRANTAKTALTRVA